VQIQIDNSDLDPKDMVLTVFNSCPFPRKGVISCLIDMPDQMGYEAFRIQSPDGQYVGRLQIKKQFDFGVLVRNLQDISIELPTHRVHCHLEVDEIPAFGYKTFHLVREEQFAHVPETLMPAANTLENEYLKVVFNTDGTLNLTHKETGHTFKGLHYLEDSGEAGHSWIHAVPDDNRIITSHGFPCSIEVEEAGPLLAMIRVTYFMQIPFGLTKNLDDQFRQEMNLHTSRTAETREMKITSQFILRAGQKRLDVKTSFENTCNNHRLRVVFPTDLNCHRTDAEIDFDVIGRDIHIKKESPYHSKPNPQYPMHRFVDMTDSKIGFAILNNSGLREYEAINSTDRPLAITLIRAFTYRQAPIFGRWEVYPEMERAQCIGKWEWTYSLYPHTGDWNNGVFEEAEDLNLPLEAAQAGPHSGILPKSLSFFEIIAPAMQLTAFKRTEDRGNSFIARLFNPTLQTINGKLRIHKDIKQAWLTNLNEERQEILKVEGREILFAAGKKKIITIEFEL
jgi:alpha-mannosidase